MEQFFVCLSVIFIILLTITPFVIWDIKKLNQKIERVFKGRQELDDADFYDSYFKAQGAPFYVVRKIRQIFAEELGADLSRLSADDDFSKNLSFFWDYDSLADVEIVTRIEEEFQIKLTPEDLQNQFRTVNGIVNLVWRKVREKEIAQ